MNLCPHMDPTDHSPVRECSGARYWSVTTQRWLWANDVRKIDKRDLSLMPAHERETIIGWLQEPRA